MIGKVIHRALVSTCPTHRRVQFKQSNQIASELLNQQRIMCYWKLQTGHSCWKARSAYPASNCVVQGTSNSDSDRMQSANVDPEPWRLSHARLVFVLKDRSAAESQRHSRVPSSMYRSRRIRGRPACQIVIFCCLEQSSRNAWLCSMSSWRIRTSMINHC